MGNHVTEQGTADPPAPPRRAPGAPRKRLVRTLLVVAAVAAAAVAAWVWRRDGAVTPDYVTSVVERGSVAPAVTASGAVNPVTTIKVGSHVSGVIQSILCDFNTQVRAGQLCAKIDPRPYQSDVAQAAAALGVARAQLEKDRASLRVAQRADERNASLLQRGFVTAQAADASRSALEQARAQLTLDQANIAQHLAMLDAARVSLGYTNITSPVDGTVVSRNVTQGQTVAASFQTPTLFLIATDLTKMQVDANVSESDIGRIAPGNRVAFTVSSYPDRHFDGSVEQVRQAPQTVQNVVTYNVVVSADNHDLALKPGMTASARIVTSQVDNALRIPSQALRFRPAQGQPGGAAATGQDRARSRSGGQAGRQAQVWILAGAKARSVAVTVGLDDDAFAQIVAGDLREGDRVILSERTVQAARAPALPGQFGMPGR